MSYVLFFYLWTASAHAGASVTMTEFSSEARCEAAGEAASKKFGGLASNPYWLCMPK